MSAKHNNRLNVRALLLASAAVLLLGGTGLRAQTPAGVSPGSEVSAEPLAGSCPTFSWSGVEGARGYELVLYRVSADGALEVALQTSVPGDARSWTPSAAACPASDGEFAWAVRALGDDGPGVWSQPLLFATPGMPSADEVRQALETLRRYRDGREGDVGEGLAPSRLPAEDPSDRRDGWEANVGEAAEPLTSPTVGDGSSPQVVTAPGTYDFNLTGDINLGGAIFRQGYPFLHNDGGAASANVALGLRAMVSTTPGLPYAFSGKENTAVGGRALLDNTSGYQNTAMGFDALRENTTGAFNVAVGTRALRNSTSGTGNTGVGDRAARSNTTGSYNTAVGWAALYSNQAYSNNTAVGYRALVLSIATDNTAVGSLALAANTSGPANTAVGYTALTNNTTGHFNTAVGEDAMLSNTTGGFNTALGEDAGGNWTTGNANIAIGRGADGVAGESGTIRIGGGNAQDRVFIEGISNATGTFNDHDVCIEGDQLGPCSSSSARFKTDVSRLGAAPALADLEPVAFRYKKEISREENPILRYGLIAEEVAEIFPSLVGRDPQGRPATVRYDMLTPLLLAESQRQQREIEDLHRQMAVRDRDLTDLRRRLDRLAKAKRYR